ncbi:hypothetical protein B0H11DRAFT_2020850 [Mycena galericulata]|nr:hypothetical protein B0H11DRAFT_2020850 [Mycena galericulata]
MDMDLLKFLANHQLFTMTFPSSPSNTTAPSNTPARRTVAPAPSACPVRVGNPRCTNSPTSTAATSPSSHTHTTFPCTTRHARTASRMSSRLLSAPVSSSSTATKVSGTSSPASSRAFCDPIATTACAAGTCTSWETHPNSASAGASHLSASASSLMSMARTTLKREYLVFIASETDSYALNTKVDAESDALHVTVTVSTSGMRSGSTRRAAGWAASAGTPHHRRSVMSSACPGGASAAPTMASSSSSFAVRWTDSRDA